MNTSTQPSGILDSPSELTIKADGITVAAAIHDLLKQSEERGQAHAVSMGLIESALRLQLQESPPRRGQQNSKRQVCDITTSSGEIRYSTSRFIIARGLPDDQTLARIRELLSQREIEVWIITRDHRVAAWKNEIAQLLGKRVGRVVVASVESFVGQNITELAGFSSSEKLERIAQLVDVYNSKWVDAVGSPSIRISIE